MTTSVKSLMAVALLIQSTSSFASPNPLRTCTVNLPTGNQMMIDIYSNKVVESQTEAGQVFSTTEKVSLVSGAVRPGLAKIAQEMFDPTSTSTVDYHLNAVELYVASAMAVTAIPGAPVGNLGFDLNEVTSAQVYLMGEAGNMGQAGVVVALDKNGKELGSYLGGMFPMPCL